MEGGMIASLALGINARPCMSVRLSLRWSLALKRCTEAVKISTKICSVK